MNKIIIVVIIVVDHDYCEWEPQPAQLVEGTILRWSKKILSKCTAKIFFVRL